MRPYALAIAAVLVTGAPAWAEEPDALLAMPMTPQTIAEGIEIDAYTLGVQAYVWGYPLVRMERVARQYTSVAADNPATSYRAPLDHIGWARELATAAAKDMPTANNDTFYMSVAVSAMASAATQSNGWTRATGLDSFGFNYPLLALVAGPYLGGNGEQEAMYPLRYTDSAGQLLSGDHAYTIRFDHAPPVDAFWSLTVYDARDKLLVDNPIGRYKVGSGTPGLLTAQDGSVTIVAQRPAPRQAANWLPTPEGPFYLVLRLYQPGAAVLDGTYSLPEVIRTGF